MNVTANVRTSVWERMLPGGMYVVLLLGLIFRLLFIGNQGFINDVRTFEAWAISLVDHGMGGFYSKTSFADYPPGYFYILWVVGEIWHAFFKVHDGSYAIIATLVKVPAIVADLLVGWLIYVIGSRFGRRDVAFGAATLYVLNPAVIFISAAWGQVDAIAGGLSLLAAYFFLRASGEDGVPTTKNARMGWIVGAWLVFGYALLIKPQSAVLIPIFIAFAFVNKAMMRERLIATGIGIVSALFAALLLTLPFHSGSPVAVFQWLLHQYAYGSSVYSYNSVNAFNLWGIHGNFWFPDSEPIGFVAQYIWGVGLVVAALALIVWRYVQDGSMRAFFESCAIALLAFFMLATRMHERYLYDGLLFVIACVPLARRYLWGAIALSVVLFANLLYSLQYLQAMTTSVPGVNEHNLWGGRSMFLSFAAVVTFFALGYLFLGAPSEASVVVTGPLVTMGRGGARGPSPWDKRPKSSYAYAWMPGWLAWLFSPPQRWFDPQEGMQALSKPLDYIVMAALGVGNFILLFINYWVPPDRIFDEVYFARAATEYLTNVRIYENTHPPLTKLLITLSVMLFGGMPAGHGIHTTPLLNGLIGHLTDGNNSVGWRFLDVVFGALVVMLIYVFAKRLTGSTVFATIAALLLSFDGMHFVQARIGTPEGFVVFFALFAVYAFYRFLIASQTSVRRSLNVPALAYVIAALVSFGCGILVAWSFVLLPWLNFIFQPLFHTVLTPVDLVPWDYQWLRYVTDHQGVAAFIQMLPSLYFACGIYLAISYFAFPRIFSNGMTEKSFGDGSYSIGETIYAADGGTFNTRTRQIVRGDSSQNKSGELVYNSGGLTIAYHADGSVDYSSPSGKATYANNETRAGGAVERGSTAKWWLLVFTIMLGLLVSSKWYGVMGFGVSFVALIGLWVQRLFLHRQPALWGNPRGFRLDRALVTIAFIAMTVYACVWIPDLLRHATLTTANVTVPDTNEIQQYGDVIERQYTMFAYHDDLRATHPYSSKWWEWPLDWVPVAYYYHDARADNTNAHACCVYEVTTMPNPFILWTGLIFVPLVGFLAWRERNKGYALLIITYLAQWLPWALSPRIAWEYHFYVNIPIICLCNTIALQRIWKWARQWGPDGRWMGIVVVGGYVLAIGLCFVFFYPVLADRGIPWDAWHARMWFPTWIIGPG